MLTETKNNANKCFNKQNSLSVHAHSSFLVHFLAITHDYKLHVLWRALTHKTTILLFFIIFWNLSQMLSITIQLQEHLPTSNKWHYHDEI